MSVRLSGSTSGYVQLSAPAVAADNVLTLPAGNGSARQGMVGDGAGNLSFQWSAGSLFYRLNSNFAGANTTLEQSVFGVGVTLDANTVYAFDALYIFSKSAGATSHSMSILFAGTASFNNFVYSALGAGDPSALPTSANSGPNNFRAPISNTPSTALQVSPSFASAAVSETVMLSGTASVSTGGTLIPRYQLSVAPGGAYSTVAGSYFRLTPIGTAGSASSQGTWS